MHYIIYLVIIVAGFLVGLVNQRKNNARFFVVILLGLTFAAEILAKILAYKIKTNILVYHVFHPMQATLWGVFFFRNMQSDLKKYVVPLWIALLVFGVLNLCYMQGIKIFPSNFAKVESVILLFWAFCYFLEFLDQPCSRNIFTNSLFIICVSVMWFNLVSFIFFELFDFFYASSKTAFSLKTTFSIRAVHYFSNYAYYTMLLFSMFLNKKNGYE